MAIQEYKNKGPIYTTAAKYEAARIAGTLEAGREYRIIDWEAQGKLTAGDNITIDENNVISASASAEYNAGNGITIEEGTISAKLGDGLKYNDYGDITIDPNIPYTYIKQVAEYLYEVQYAPENIDYDFANSYYQRINDDDEEVLPGGCTGVIVNGKAVRNLDWYYNNECEFIVRTTAVPEKNIYGSVGVCTGVTGLTADLIASKVYNEKLKLIPLTTVDGINDKGLYIQSNVVPYPGYLYDINPGATTECCIPMISRYILDHCATIEEAKNAFSTIHIYGTDKMKFGCHYLIAQGNNWVIVELDNDGPHFADATTLKYPIMTNFRMNNLEFDDNNKIVWESIEDYGMGVERYDMATQAIQEEWTPERLREELLYSNTYFKESDKWYTEFAGEKDPDDESHKLTVMDAKNNPAPFEIIIANEKQKIAQRTREDGKGSWHTTHGCIYDLAKKSFNVISQENKNISYDFELENNKIEEEYTAGNGIIISNKVISADVRTYKPFPSSWPVGQTTTKASFFAAVNASYANGEAKDGDVFLGHVDSTSFFEGAYVENGGALGSAEVSVQIMKAWGDGCVQLLTTTSSNNPPYHWEYTHVDNIAAEGWRCWSSLHQDGTTIINSSNKLAVNPNLTLTTLTTTSTASLNNGSLQVKKLANNKPGVIGSGSLVLNRNTSYNEENIGENSVIVGMGCHTKNQAAIAAGKDSVAGGSFSCAINQETNAGAVASFAQGYQTWVSGVYSQAFGKNTIAAGGAQTVLGQWNIPNVSDKMIVGTGSGETNKSGLSAETIIGYYYANSSPAKGENKYVLITAENAEEVWNNSSITKVYNLNNALVVKNNGEVVINKLSDGTNSFLTTNDVVNNITSTSTDLPLSANMGKELQVEINNLKNIGRFLAIWDASTGSPTSEPTTSPYEYKVGDYYRIGVSGTKNPAPNLTYITDETNWVEGGQLEIGDVVYCSTLSESASTWVRQVSSGGGTVQDVQVEDTSVLSGGIAKIPNSSTTASGVMTSAQYTKLEGIEAGAEVNPDDYLAYSAQSLTDTQKTQARTNIGALALEEYNSSATPVDNVLYYVVE